MVGEVSPLGGGTEAGNETPANSNTYRVSEGLKASACAIAWIVAADGTPAVPNSTRVYQLSLIPARAATSSRRKPGVFRRDDPLNPACSGSRCSR